MSGGQGFAEDCESWTGFRRRPCQSGGQAFAGDCVRWTDFGKGIVSGGQALAGDCEFGKGRPNSLYQQQ